MPKFVDITGQAFGTWTALSYAGRSEWNCRCSCGAVKVARSKELRKGQHRTCAACGVRAVTQLLDLVGQRFGRLVVIARSERARGTYWTCKCDCGNEKVVLGKHLRRGAVRSCKCLTREVTSRLCLTQNGLMAANRLEYSTWRSMLARCEKHHDYAGRGITVCERWRASFADFLADMGKRQSRQYSIERINNDGHYEPGNCRWATRHEQARNKRGNRRVTIGDQTMIMSDWAKHVGVALQHIYSRLAHGWSEERAIMQPSRHITRTPAYEATRPGRAA